jgi:hypothetical protein
LIAIGGVLYSDALTADTGLTATEAAASNKTSPTFMQNLPVYDVANNQWYMQQTSGDIPPQLTLFCSVVAAAADNSSYNIYIYGGYDGIDSGHTTYDDVYVLSIPSFTWVKVYSGTSTHGRSGHKCVQVYPDQMFVLGGIHQGDVTVCLEGGIVEVFNLNTLTFQDSYSPATWSKYQVPSLVTAQIGGNGQGGATKNAPANWTTSLATVFQSKYPGTITTYYPYSLANATSTPSASLVPSNSGGGSKIPTWLGAVIGVILGVGVIAIFLVVWFCCRRRSKSPREASSTSDSNTRIFNWINAAKSPTTMVSVDPSSTNDQDVRDRMVSETESVTSAGATAVSDGFVYESGGGQVHELDSSRPIELPTTYNSSSINQATVTRLHRTSDSPSLDEIAVLPYQLTNVSPGAGIQNNESRPSHRHQGSGGSVSLPDIAEEQHPHRESTASVALSEISEEMSSRITRLHHSSNFPEIISPDIMVSPDSMVSSDVAGNRDAAASPDSISSTHIFSPDTVGLANPAEPKPDSDKE